MIGGLASSLYLEISSMTRVIDVLVKQGHVVRVPDPNDRRVCRARITRKGRTLVARVRADIIAGYAKILQNIDRSGREAVILAIGEMLAACRCCKACE